MELHDDGVETAEFLGGLDEGVDLADVGEALESLEHLVFGLEDILGLVGLFDLERHALLELGIERLVDDAYRTRGEPTS